MCSAPYGLRKGGPSDSGVGMARAMSARSLERERAAYRHTGGVSEHNREHGFRPAFRDLATGRIFLSCLADGALAGFHCLDGLPEELVLSRDSRGCVCGVKPGVESGFVRDGRFFTREEAAARVLADE